MATLHTKKKNLSKKRKKEKKKYIAEYRLGALLPSEFIPISYF